jgi:hypothetical protein
MAVVVGLVVVVVSLVLMGRRGSGRIEQWIGRQVQQMVSSALKPQLRFKALDYQYPRTAVLTECRLTAPDPMNPKTNYDIVAADRITLELAEIPRHGRPIVIKRITMDSPAIRLIATEPGSNQFIGFSDMVREPGDQAGPPIALSELLVLRQITINNGLVLYDLRDPEALPMWLDQINTQLRLDPADAAWHHVELKISRAPVFDLGFTGRLNLDVMQLQIQRALVGLYAEREHDRFLPPQLQNFMRRHDVTGNLQMLAEGLLPLDDPANASLAFRIDGQDVNMAFDDYRLPIEKVSGRLATENQKLQIDQLMIRGLGGQVDLKGQVGLTDDGTAQLQAEAGALRLEQLLRGGEQPMSGEPAEATPPRMAGQVDAVVIFEAPLTAMTTQTRGQGRVTLTDGRVVNLPVISGLARTAAKANVLGSQQRGTDRAEIEFNFIGDAIALTDIYFTTQVLTARGNGRIGFDGQMDLTFNGGPMEKVQDKLGAVGRMMGRLTDSLARYTVTGHVADPKISMKLGGQSAEQRAALEAEVEASTEPATSEN